MNDVAAPCNGPSYKGDDIGEMFRQAPVRWQTCHGGDEMGMAVCRVRCAVATVSGRSKHDIRNTAQAKTLISGRVQ